MKWPDNPFVYMFGGLVVTVVPFMLFAYPSIHKENDEIRAQEDACIARHGRMRERIGDASGYYCDTSCVP